MEKDKLIVIKFEKPNIGEEFRKQYKQIQLKYDDPLATPIMRVSVEYGPGDKKKAHTTSKAKVIQFPIKLAWAITAHKVQGQTIHDPQPVGMDIQSTFTKAQPYVMLSRTQNIDQVFLSEFFHCKRRHTLDI